MNSDKMKIPSDIKHIRKVSNKLEGFLKSNNIDESVIFDIRLSAEEAIKNAIIHGNKKRRELPVHIEYSLENGAFKVVVEDRGAGFNPESLPDPTAEENLYKDNGRGTYQRKRSFHIGISR